MCRMLERYMDEDTKALILDRITTNDEIGLSYQQNGAAHQSPHFNLNPLKDTLQAYVTGYDAWYAASNWRALHAAWMAVGLVQRDVPVHVAQEYCRPDRSFDPCPEFNEASLPRVLSIYDDEGVSATWFSPPLGCDYLWVHFSIERGDKARGAWWAWFAGRSASCDLAAISRLDEVRTAQLTQSREYLQSSAASHRSSRFVIAILKPF